MSKLYEQLSITAQVSLDSLRKELISSTDLNLVLLEKNQNAYHAFLGFCAGYLRGQGCSVSDASAAVAFAKSKDFWLPRSQPKLPKNNYGEIVTADYVEVIEGAGYY